MTLGGSATAGAQNYYLQCNPLPYPCVDNCYNTTVSWNWQNTFTTVDAYGSRRVKFNDHNPHSTRVSYNLSYDYSIYEVTDIPLNDHVAHYFTTAHPGVFGDSGDGRRRPG